MVSHIAAYSSICFTVSRQPISYLNPPRFFPVVFVISPPKRQHPLRPKRKQVNPKNQSELLFEFADCCEVARMCKTWETEGDPTLELEVLEFMKNSKNPDKFPSKRELFEAGKGDLVEAILKRGGWMSIGWEDDEFEREKIEDGVARNWEFEFGVNGKNVFEGEISSGSELNEGISTLSSSSPAASSSGRSLEMTAEDERGIEGILNRLERQRNLTFGGKMRKIGGINHVTRDFGKDEQSGGMSKDVDSCHPERRKSTSLGCDGPLLNKNGLVRSHSDVLNSSVNSWRTWSIQRAGFTDTEFEAAEIDFGGNTNGRTMDKYMGDITTVSTDIKEPVDRKDLSSYAELITQGDVKSRLRHLEVELSSTLCSLRSNSTDLSEKVQLHFYRGSMLLMVTKLLVLVKLRPERPGVSLSLASINQTKEHLPEELRQLSDASEFQENEIMNAQGKLRSLRAKLAVLEGKMTLAILDAQKILDEKQKRITDAHRALQLLRTTSIVWPNSGSEVLLAGSFDGWATQRKMERSKTGVFSLQLKLYPGKYEIKFIVDGSWKVDPLRPIVNNNGFENNLLIIT